MKIHHIGYLVKCIEKAIPQFESIGFSKEGSIVYDKLRDIDILFMINGDYRVELVSPKSDTSVVSDTIKKIGNAPYHICYYCRDIKEQQQILRQEGFVPAGKVEPAVAIEGNDVCFMYNKQIGLIELLQNSKKEK